MKRFLSLTLVFAVLVGFVATAAERRDIAVQYTWRLTDLYASPQAWKAARQKLMARLPELDALKGHLGDSPARLLQALTVRESIGLELAKLQAYAMFLQDQDARDSEAQVLSGDADKTANAVMTASAWFSPEILKVGPEKIAAFIKAEPKLAPFRQGLDDILRRRAHTLPGDQEKLFARCSEMAQTPGTVRNLFVAADLPYPEITLPGGEKVRLDPAGYERVRVMPDRAARIQGFQAYYGAYNGFRRTLGSLLYNLVMTHVVNKDVRHYKSSLAAALDATNVPTAVYTQLIAATHANLGTLHRYLRLRQKMLGLPDLRYEDLYTPLVKKVDMTFTPEQAMALVERAVAPLGPLYAQGIKQAFGGRWIDWMPTTGKRSGAYMQDVYGVHPYMLLNFNGGYKDVSTLAHEGGHAMHSWLTDRKQRYANSDYSIFVAEVASTMNENLLFHKMYDEAKDDETRLFLLGERLETFRTTCFRQVMFAEFELKIHDMVDKGQTLTGDSLNKTYLDLVRTYYGSAQGICKVDDLYGVEWASVPHFYYNFYVFQYATSLMASTFIADRIRAEEGSTKARDAYLTFLSSGSTRYPIDLLKAAGVDMTTPVPFKSAMREMNDIMDKIEAILAKR